MRRNGRGAPIADLPAHPGTGTIDPGTSIRHTIRVRPSGMARISVPISRMKSITMARRHANGC